MQYTNYFKRIVDMHGIPEMSVDNHKKFLNVLVLEAKIFELQKLKRQLKNASLDSRILAFQKQLTLLTGNHGARKVLNELLKPNPKWANRLDEAG